jgi:SAM-dependent methyltransferase
VITVAARVGILRRLADTPATTDQVAHDLDLDSLATGKVVRALTALGLVAADGNRYSVVPSLAPHLREGPDDVTPFLNHHHHMYDNWGAHLEPWLRGDEWPTQHRTSDDTARFGAAMRAIGSQMAKTVAQRLSLEGAERMLDVGGGFGQYARALCRVQPRLRATVLDVPPVAEMAARANQSTEFADRIEFVGGDYLESDYGSGFDLVLFANVLHQETADRAAEMVRRGATALDPGGRVAVVDFRIDDTQREHVQGCLFAINMRSFGDTHTEPSIRGWMEAAGLAGIERVDLDPVRWLILGRSAG